MDTMLNNLLVYSETGPSQTVSLLNCSPLPRPLPPSAELTLPLAAAAPAACVSLPPQIAAGKGSSSLGVNDRV